MCLQGNLTVWSQTPGSHIPRFQASSRRSPWEAASFRGLPSFEASRYVCRRFPRPHDHPVRCVLFVHLIDETAEALGDQISPLESNSRAGTQPPPALYSCALPANVSHDNAWLPVDLWSSLYFSCDDSDSITFICFLSNKRGEA